MKKLLFGAILLPLFGFSQTANVIYAYPEPGQVLYCYDLYWSSGESIAYSEHGVDVTIKGNKDSVIKDMFFYIFDQQKREDKRTEEDHNEFKIIVDLFNKLPGDIRAKYMDTLENIFDRHGYYRH